MRPNACIQPEQGFPAFRHNDSKDDSVIFLLNLLTCLLAEMGLLVGAGRCTLVCKPVVPDLGIRRENPFSFAVLFAKFGRDHGETVVCVVMCGMVGCLGAPGDPK